MKSQLNKSIKGPVLLVMFIAWSCCVNGQNTLIVRGNKVNKEDVETAASAVQTLLITKDFQELYKMQMQWKAWPESRQKELIILLLEQVESTRFIDVTNYADLVVESRLAAKKMTWGGHGYILKQDVFTVGGRCAWILESLLDCSLPVITEDMKPEKLREVVKDLNRYVIRNMYMPNETRKPH